MILHVLRALFIVVMTAIGYSAIKAGFSPAILAISIAVAVVFVVIDILAPRRKLAIFSGSFLGLLVGLALAYAMSFAVALIADLTTGGLSRNNTPFIQTINLLVGGVCCFLAISFVLQTKDDFRFIIPYVEFRRQTKGARAILLDTSALIDGRIADLTQTGLFESQLIVPRFVLQELQAVADHSDRLKRNRGRRGLDVLAKLQNDPRLDVVLFDAAPTPGDNGVDQRLVRLGKQLEARLLTTDFNLLKVAQLAGLAVINLNDIAAALRPAVLPGERLRVRLVRIGEDPQQGVGFLDDGTMVVVENGRPHINEEVDFTITNTRQTSAGRMIFGRIGDAVPPEKPQPPQRRFRGREPSSQSAGE